MEFIIKELEKKDHKQVIQFAITGMNFHLYLQNNFLLKLYGTYFWFDELNKATQLIAAYAGDQLAGVLLAEMKNEKRKYKTLGKTIYVKIFDFLQKLVSKKGVGVYDKANKKMFEQYKRYNHPDGEIIFLAANPKIKTKGIGSLLLNELEKREKGKQIYLYTDDACTYQFYEHRGFDRVGEKDITLALGAKKVPLKCFLYSKKIIFSE